MLLQWAGCNEATPEEPEDLQLAEFFPATVSPSAAVAEASQRLHVTGVPAWGAIVAARGKANDDHIKLFGTLLCCLPQTQRRHRRNLVQPLQRFCVLCRGWARRSAQVGGHHRGLERHPHPRSHGLR